MNEMISRIKIPKRAFPIMIKILDLEENQKEFLENQFKNLKPTIAMDFLNNIQPLEGFDDFRIILQELIVYYSLFYHLQEDNLVSDLEDFILNLKASFIEEYESIDKPKADDFDAKVQSMGKFLKKILTSNEVLYFIEKARHLLTEQSRLIENTRIITDLRPVFEEKKIKYPLYCVIFHNLRIEYSKDLGTNEKAFFTLDHNDLIQLQKQIDRALKKEEEMQKLCEKSGLINLGV